MYLRCWVTVELLDGWVERTKESEVLPWADGASHKTRFLLGCVLGDQQEGDNYTGELCVLYRCWATRDKYLETDNLQQKTMKQTRARIETCVAGVNLRANRKDKWIVKWDSDGRNVRPGPGTGTNRTILFMLLICIFPFIFIIY